MTWCDSTDLLIALGRLDVTASPAYLF